MAPTCWKEACQNNFHDSANTYMYSAVKRCLSYNRFLLFLLFHFLNILDHDQTMISWVNTKMPFKKKKNLNSISLALAKDDFCQTGNHWNGTCLTTRRRLKNPKKQAILILTFRCNKKINKKLKKSERGKYIFPALYVPCTKHLA